MSLPDIRPNEFEIWMNNYKAEMREAEDEQSRQTDGVNSDLPPNDDEKATLTSATLACHRARSLYKPSARIRVGSGMAAKLTGQIDR
jgi:hypothetical protein